MREITFKYNYSNKTNADIDIECYSDGTIHTKISETEKGEFNIKQKENEDADSSDS